MMITLFPRLPRPVALEIAERLSRATNVHAFDSAGLKHEAAIYAPTGGRRIMIKELADINTTVREVADQLASRPKDHKRAFDARVGSLLYRTSKITPTEASREEVWSFFGCVMFPDLVRWRWGGTATPTDRFLGGSRGLRNTFGRLWWRAYMLHDQWWAERDALELLFELVEDEIVGFVERADAVVSPLTCVAMIRAVLETGRKGTDRMYFMREVTKRFRRLGAIMDFEALEPNEMLGVARDIVSATKA